MARTKDRARQEPNSLLFRTATYARLSVDSAVTESDSITSQQMLMRDFLKGRDEFFLSGSIRMMGSAEHGLTARHLTACLGK